MKQKPKSQGLGIPVPLGRGGCQWRPNAVKIAVGKINAVSGKSWQEKLNAGEQDYLVCPTQPWLDGINSGDGYIRQFVAMPLGMGYTVEAQVSGKEEFGGIQIMVFDPKPGKFPDQPPRMEQLARGITLGGIAMAAAAPPAPGAEMGLAAGGKMQQKIYPDPHGIDTWDQTNFGRVYIQIVNSMMYREITGQEPPATPVSAKTYTQYGFPWFALYDEAKGDLAAADALTKVKSIKEMDKEKGFAPQQDDSSLEITNQQIKKLPVDPNQVRDGDW